MKAAYYQRNRTITIDTAPVRSPNDDEVQIRVSHCGICGTDLHIFHGNMDHRVAQPQIMGHEMSGVLEDVGDGIHNFAIGDHVTVRPLNPCGRCPACRRGNSHICANLKFLGIDSPGALQEIWTVPASTVHKLPRELPFEAGALIEPLAVACHDVRRGNVQPGEFVTILGGGPIGTLIGCVARAQGARVLISEPNGFRAEFARSLGMEAVDPRAVDLTDVVNERTDGAGADVVFEVAGVTASVEAMTKLPRARGRIVLVAIHNTPVSVDLFRFFWRELNLLGARVYEPEDFEQPISLASDQLLALERFVTKVVPLECTTDAFREIDSGGNSMKVLVNCRL